METFNVYYRSYKKDKEEKIEWNVSLPDCFQPLWKKTNDN